VEGADLGYRWNARKGHKALFPFGYGLSYTSFAQGAPSVTGTTASWTVRNTGQRSGATVAQLYLTARGGKAERRLVGYRRVDLAPGASQTVTVTIDPRLLADWQGGGWAMPGGRYGFASGASAEDVGQTIEVAMPARRWHDPNLGASR
jgi:beta-glucosidase